MTTDNPVSQPPVAEAPERIWIDANSLEYARRRKCGSWWFEPYAGVEETSIEYARADPASSITEKAQRAARALLMSEYLTPRNDALRLSELVQKVAAIIANEFQDSKSSGPSFHPGPKSGSGST